MINRDFKVVLKPDEDRGYFAVCPSLPGCYSQGKTVPEALANIREAIGLCLEDIEDLYLAEDSLKSIRKGQEQTIPLKAVMKRHGLKRRTR
jgi:predicted RNase H-like HicB family nuclease